MADIWDNLRSEAETDLDALIYQTKSSVASECESPIEHAFLVAVIVLNMLHGGGRPIVGIPAADHTAEAQLLRRPLLYIAPQHEFAPYRADFVMGFAGYGAIQQTGVIVECDGHQFHEKTRDQAQRDKERDRYLNTQAAKVIRFTGSEIFRSPLTVAENALHVTETAMLNWMTS